MSIEKNFQPIFIIDDSEFIDLYDFMYFSISKVYLNVLPSFRWFLSLVSTLYKRSC